MIIKTCSFCLGFINLALSWESQITSSRDANKDICLGLCFSPCLHPALISPSAPGRQASILEGSN